MRRRFLAIVGSTALLLVGLPVALAPAATAAPTELFISEYIEGTSNNKALEIYNGTGAAVDLASGGYSVQMFFNGNPAAGLTVNLTGTVANGDVFVLAQSSASAAILAQADQTNGAGWFNGDDAVVLRKGTTVVDVIGQIGFDPGVEWGTGLVSTADNTLRRQAAVEVGDADGSNVFDPSVEWDGYATDTFGGLGAHLQTSLTADCGDPVAGNQGTTVEAQVTARDTEAKVVDIQVTAVAPSDPGTFSRTAFTASAAVGDTATATIAASDTTPPGTYTLTVTATNDEATPQTASCALTVTVTDCGAPATPIHAVQGSGAASPLEGQDLTVEGVVVGDYQGAGQFGGYYVQEEDEDVDANPATSEGIFVFNTATPVAVGDVVRVSGTVIEFSNLTELTNVAAATVCGSGASVTPTTVTLPVTSVSDWERYEGMLLSLTDQLTVTEVFTLARFGEVALSVGGRLSTPTNEVAPGAPAQQLQALNDRRRILLDDGNNQQNIDPTRYPQGGLSAANTLRVGDTVTGVSGVGDQRFGDYRIQPVDTGSISFTHSNPRPASPVDVGGDVQVAAFNVLNYFNGDGQGGGFPTSRGASNALELERQSAKIVAAVTALDAEVVGLMELENDDPATGYAAVEELVDRLNAATAPGTYAFVDTGVVGTDEIRVGLLYRPAAVTPVGPHAILDSTDDPRFDDDLNRPSVAQTFETGDGGRFTVVVNHLKSKGSDCNAVGDPDTGDGQGNCNLTRTNAARALVDWLATDPTGSGDADRLVLGDLNAYAQEDPVTVLRNAGYVDTIDTFAGSDAYSYVFDGQSGYLDHALASPTLAAQVTGVTEWHVNADEPTALDYNVEFKSAGQVVSFYDPGPYRSSDHDPVLVGLDLGSYDFDGFYAPVDNPPVLNTVRAGRTVPVSFSLGGDEGLAVLAQGSPSSRPIACETGVGSDPVESTSAAGASGLQYDALTGTYTYAWKTSKSWSGCRRLTLTFVDGTVRYADFRFLR